MTDFELVYMFVETYDAVSSALMNFASIVFAFIAASFFFAQKLNRWMGGLFIGIYSGSLLLIGTTISRGFQTMMNLGWEIKQSYIGGNEAFRWHSASQANDWQFTAGPVILYIILIGSFLASLAFFLGQQKEADNSTGQTSK